MFCKSWSNLFWEKIIIIHKNLACALSIVCECSIHYGQDSHNLPHYLISANIVLIVARVVKSASTCSVLIVARVVKSANTVLIVVRVVKSASIVLIVAIVVMSAGTE